MKPDQPLLQQEAREQIRRALLSYPGSAIHTAIYALRRSMPWNDLQVALKRSSAPSDPEKVKTICTAVQEHLRTELQDYFEGHNE